MKYFYFVILFSIFYFTCTKILVWKIWPPPPIWCSGARRRGQWTLRKERNGKERSILLYKFLFLNQFFFQSDDCNLKHSSWNNHEIIDSKKKGRLPEKLCFKTKCKSILNLEHVSIEGFYFRDSVGLGHEIVGQQIACWNQNSNWQTWITYMTWQIRSGSRYMISELFINIEMTVNWDECFWNSDILFLCLATLASGKKEKGWKEKSLRVVWM